MCIAVTDSARCCKGGDHSTMDPGHSTGDVGQGLWAPSASKPLSGEFVEPRSGLWDSAKGGGGSTGHWYFCTLKNLAPRATGPVSSPTLGH